MKLCGASSLAARFGTPSSRLAAMVALATMRPDERTSRVPCVARLGRRSGHPLTHPDGSRRPAELVIAFRTRTMTDSGDRCLDALRPVLADSEDGEHPAYRGVPVAFVGAVEMLGDDGEPYIVILRSPSTQPIWRILGLVEYVAADIRGRVGAPADEDG